MRPMIPQQRWQREPLLECAGSKIVLAAGRLSASGVYVSPLVSRQLGSARCEPITPTSTPPSRGGPCIPEGSRLKMPLMPVNALTSDIEVADFGTPRRLPPPAPGAFARAALTSVSVSSGAVRFNRIGSTVDENGCGATSDGGVQPTELGCKFPLHMAASHTGAHPPF